MTPLSSRRSRAVAEACEPRRLLAFDFTFTQNVGPGAFRAAGDIDVGDMNGDGIPDTVNTNWLGSDFDRVNVWLGTNGRGNFAQQADIVSNTNLGGIRLGDLNGDSRLDLVYTAQGANQVRVRLGVGDGTFGSEATFGNVTDRDPLLNNLELADIDGDNKLDAVVGNVNSGVRVLRGDGSGAFNSTPYLTFDGNGVNSLNVLDVSNDGAPDIVYASRVNSDIITLTNLRGAPTASGFDIAGGLNANTQLTVANAGGNLGIVFAIVEQPGNDVSGRLIYGRNPLNPTDLTQFSNTSPTWGRPAIGDFDGDGVADLGVPTRALTDLRGSMQLQSGTTSGSPFGAATRTVQVGVRPFGARAADVNGDGNLDLLVGADGRGDGYDDYSVFINNQQSLVVSTTADENDGNARWNSGSGASLREALQFASTRSGPQTIRFAPFIGSDLTFDLNSALSVGNGTSVTIASDGRPITLHGSGSDRVLVTGQHSTVTLRNLTITNGVASGNRGGGVLAGPFSTLVVDGCTFVGNAADGEGGALYGDVGSTVRVTNSTFAGNTGIGAIATVAGMTLQHVTVAGNTARSGLNGSIGGISGSASIIDSILANNGGPDLGGGSFTGTNNVITNAVGVTNLPGNTISADPLLGPLASNGGLTLTMRLLLNSPAINAGVTLAAITTDQRGIARPQNGSPDLGAYEARVATSPSFGTGSLSVRQNTPPIDLAAGTSPNPAGGTFSGPGVANGVFDPASVAVGTYNVRYTLPTTPSGFDLPGSASLSINVQATLIIASAFIRVTPQNNPAAAGSTFPVSVQIANLRDQFNAPIVPTSSASVRYQVPGQADQVYTFTPQQVANWQTYSIDFPTNLPTPGAYTVTAVVTLDGYNFTGSNTANIANFAPFNVQVAAPSVAGQTSPVTVRVDFEDYGPLDAHNVSIDWGDGSTPSTGGVPTGARSLSFTRTYAPGYHAFDDYTITATVTDNYSTSASATRVIRVVRPNQLVVTTSSDEDNATADPLYGAGASLREALKFAEQNPGPDTITFAPNLNGQTIALTAGWNGIADDTALRVLGDVTIDGANRVTLAIPAGAKRRHILSGSGTFRLQNIDVRDGNLAGVNNGGAIFSFGPTFVDNVRFTNNAANNGGAIQSFGALTISRSTFEQNATSNGGYGGAIAADSGTLSIDSSTFANNDAGSGNGGAIANFGAAVSVTNSTYTQNSAVNGGAIIHYGNTMSLAHVTIVGNTAGFSGGGVERVGRVGNPLSIRNSLIANNAAPGFGPDVASYPDANNGAVESLGNNLIGAGNGSIGFTNGVNGDRVGTSASPIDPRVGPLANNGGATQTMALLPGSPAINAGAAIAGVSTDQRGTARPQGGAPDIGAFERIATTAVVTSTTFEVLTRQVLLLSFDADASATFARSDLTLQNRTTEQTLNTGTFAWNDDGTQATVDLTNQLPDGNYRATIGGQSVDFFVLAGDFNRDRTANFDDLLILAVNYNQSGRNSAQGDANYDGTVNFADLLLLAANYNRSLPGEAPGAIAAPPAPVRASVDPPADQDDDPSSVIS